MLQNDSYNCKMFNQKLTNDSYMKHPLKTSTFDYHLPDELIARYPLAQRADSRLLCVERASRRILQRSFKDFVSLVEPNDLIIFNDTRVIPARLFGKKITGGKIECLIERIIDTQKVLAHVRASHAPLIGSELIVAENFRVRVIGREQSLFQLEFLTEQPILSILQEYGEIPLPHYMERKAEKLDQERYQTIFARREGAVAAPTAALHFDEPTIQSLLTKGVEIDFVTLHVGAGTFQPVREEELQKHVMHKEYVEVSEELCEKIRVCKKNQGRVIAIGTTVVRSLETAAREGEIKAFQGDTQIFIYPGYSFQCVDVLFTNFHLPKSTLLMLVTAFGGYELITEAYQIAINERYRFFSYGDAMMIV